MYPRYTTQNVQAALADTPVVFLMGPRQVGKTTLARTLMEAMGEARWNYLTLDDKTQHESASADPAGFIRGLPGTRIALDEVQRVPALFPAIKQAVDEVRTPGRFLLTGSANALLLPQLVDFLVGRMEAVPLMPLSECEIAGRQPSFLARLLGGEAPRAKAKEVRVREHLLQRLVAGGFPEPLQRARETRQRAWHQHYLNALIQRDLRDIAQIEHPAQMTSLLKLAALHSGRLVNFSEWSGKLGLSRETVKGYVTLLQQLFLLELLPAWHSSDAKRLVKTPKLHLTDTGLICALSGLGTDRLRKQPERFGQLLESFVHNELRKQAAWLAQAGDPLAFSHYRDKDQVEVDLILETPARDCFAIEVKAAASLSQKDFTPLKRFQQRAGKRFRMGVLLYDGDHTTAFGKNLYAVPLAALWA